MSNKDDEDLGIRQRTLTAKERAKTNLIKMKKNSKTDEKRGKLLRDEEEEEEEEEVEEKQPTNHLSPSNWYWLKYYQKRRKKEASSQTDLNTLATSISFYVDVSVQHKHTFNSCFNPPQPLLVMLLLLSAAIFFIWLL